MEISDFGRFNESNFDKIVPAGFVDGLKVKNAISKLKYLYVTYIKEMLEINDKVVLPPEIKDRVEWYADIISSFLRQIEREENGDETQITSIKLKLLNEIQEFYDSCYNIQDIKSNQMIVYYSIVKSLAKTDFLKLNEANVNIIQENREKSEQILQELQKKVSEQSVSDYAGVFEVEAKNHKTHAWIWLGSGIILTILFVFSLYMNSIKNFFQTEVYNSKQEFLHYSYSNILAEILIIAILIFLISFSFKQFNINRHLFTLNKHRQNALNSYKLFANSIVGDDISSRNALMIQVAKAIYENSQSTGFLNEKGHNINSGIVEITKMIGKNAN
ncbi:hypothetical protein JXM83_02515 [Candidatus Woesearchaeota archaeon]|nr:hypothetical protein [Candidatus Woesearchaeota archaeon]